MNSLRSAVTAIYQNLHTLSDTGRRAAELSRLSEMTDTELQRMGINRDQMVHYVFSGHQIS